MTFGTVAILGPGLIGGSLALALAERGLADRLVIYGRKNTTFPEIKKRIPQAHLTTDVVEAVRGADVVVLCVPIETMAGLVKQFADSLKPTALVTDVGSVKESVDRELAPLLDGKALWIGSHPMAGSEKAGFSAARANLFVGARVIITPRGINPDEKEALVRAKSFWHEVGGAVLKMGPFEHDLAVAHISHLPHIVAAALVNATSEENIIAAGSGFRDTTRIASGSPDLWTEIIFDNRQMISQALREFIAQLQIFQEAIKTGEKSTLHDALKTAHDHRAKLLP